MKKAVIVIDMPKRCKDCFRYQADAWFGGSCRQVKEENGWNKKIEADEEYNVQNWCPLRPLPEKWERKPYNSDSRVDWQNGYNHCLDDIQGIEDKNERENQWWAEHSSRFD